MFDRAGPEREAQAPHGAEPGVERSRVRPGEGRRAARRVLHDPGKGIIMSADQHHDEDVKVLHGMGYAQELSRRMGLFQNFAISFSIICILAGGITAFPLSLSGAGGASLGLGWPVATIFALLVAGYLAIYLLIFLTRGPVG